MVLNTYDKDDDGYVEYAEYRKYKMEEQPNPTTTTTLPPAYVWLFKTVSKQNKF